MSIRAAYEAGQQAAFKKFGWNMPPQVMAALKSPHLRNAIPGAVAGGLGGALTGAMAAPEGERGMGALTNGLMGAAGGGLGTAVGTHLLDRHLGASGGAPGSRHTRTSTSPGHMPGPSDGSALGNRMRERGMADWIQAGGIVPEPLT